MRRAEITEEKLRDGRATYYAGDVVTVDDTKAAHWIAKGWAKDPETGEQGERVPGASAPVRPDNITTPIS